MPGEFDDLIPTRRRKKLQQFEPATLEDILAGRVDNDAFFDIDDIPEDAPAIAPDFVAQDIEPADQNIILLEPTEEQFPATVALRFPAPETRRVPRQTIDEILAGEATDEALIGFDARRDTTLPAGTRAPFDGDDVSFAARRAVNAADAQPVGRATIEQLLNPQVEVDASRPPRPSPTFGTPQAIPERRSQQIRPRRVPRQTIDEILAGEATDEALIGFDARRDDGLPNRSPQHAQPDPATEDPSGERAFVEPIDIPRVRRDNKTLRREIGEFEAGLLGAVSGISGNAFDEIIAGLVTVGRRFNGDERPLSEIYAESIAPMRELIAEARRQNPTASTVGEVIGFALGPAKFLRFLNLGSRLAPRLGTKLTSILGAKWAPRASKTVGLSAAGALTGAVTGAAGADGKNIVNEMLANAAIGSVLGPAGTLLGNATGKAVDIAVGRFGSTSPLTGLKETARQAITEADTLGVSIKNRFLPRLGKLSRDFANRHGVKPKNAPETFKILESIEKTAGRGTTFGDILRVRTQLRAISQNSRTGTAERELAASITTRLDNSIARLSEKSLDGLPTSVAKLSGIKEAWRRTSAGEIIDDALRNVRREAGSNITSPKSIQLLRKEFKNISQNKTKMLGLTKEEQELVRHVATGGSLQELFAGVAKRADGRRAIPRAVKDLTGAAARRVGGTFGGSKGANTAERLAHQGFQNAISSTRQSARTAESGLSRLSGNALNARIRTDGKPGFVGRNAEDFTRSGIRTVGQLLKRSPIPDSPSDETIR